MIQINLLTWREQAKQKNKIRFAVLSVGFVILAVFFIVIIHIYYNRLIFNQLQRNNYLQSVLSKEQDQLTILIAKKKEQDKDESVLHYILSLRIESYNAVKLLDTLARIVPEGLSFNKIIRDGKKIEIIGKARSDSQITALMANITKSNVFKQPKLTQINAKQSATGDERLFQLKVEQQE